VNSSTGRCRAGSPSAPAHSPARRSRGDARRAASRRRQWLTATVVTLVALGLVTAGPLVLRGLAGIPGLSVLLGPPAPDESDAGDAHASDSSPGPSRPSPASPTTVPQSGPGTFTIATAGVQNTGAGRPYRVEVEDGTGVDPDEAAEQIAAILNHERGWSRGGGAAFRQVSDASASLVIRIATPDTADSLCAAGGLDTKGELNCRVGRTVAVNLKRWLLGSPQFDGPAEEYRALIINHEVGHWLGYGHRGCPGPGKPAPVMMQQIKGLDGCTSNAWPYSSDGTFLDGPEAP